MWWQPVGQNTLCAGICAASWVAPAHSGSAVLFSRRKNITGVKLAAVDRQRDWQHPGR